MDLYVRPTGLAYAVIRQAEMGADKDSIHQTSDNPYRCALQLLAFCMYVPVTPCYCKEAGRISYKESA